LNNGTKCKGKDRKANRNRNSADLLPASGPYFHNRRCFGRLCDKIRYPSGGSARQDAGNCRPNYKEARLRLEKLVREHPDGKWTPAAGALIACIQKIAELQNQLRLDKQRAQSDHGKLAREIEGLRDGIRQTEEKYSAELIRLQQENEQLKKDIQQLKNLEIQLEKREKMLR
jgi:vacuolar-type H+-ATPase subunit I/STV1